MKRHHDSGVLELSARDVARRPFTVANELSAGDLVYMPPEEAVLNRDEDDRLEDMHADHKPCVHPCRVRADVRALRAALRDRGFALVDRQAFYFEVVKLRATSRTATHARSF